MRGSRLPFPGHSDIWALCKHLALPTSFTSCHSTLWLYYRNLYFPEEETEAQRGQASHPRSRSYRVAEVGFDPRSAETSTHPTDLYASRPLFKLTRADLQSGNAASCPGHLATRF